MSRELCRFTRSAVVFEQADGEFDNLVAIRVGASGFYIHDGGDELWTTIGWVVLGLRLQSSGDAIIAALDERSGRVFGSFEGGQANLGANAAVRNGGRSHSRHHPPLSPAREVQRAAVRCMNVVVSRRGHRPTLTGRPRTTPSCWHAANA